MAESDAPQIYLITPPTFDPGAFQGALQPVLDATPVACLRLALAATDPDALARAADAVREVAHARDIPLVVERHAGMVERLGLDGVHLTDGARSVRKTRAALGAEAIVGAFCGASRHDGIIAGEAGADYVAFGPVAPSPLGDDTLAEPELFAWWSEMIELPVVAEGGLDLDRVRALAPVADFLAFGPEVWESDDPPAALAALAAAMRG